MIVQGQCVEAGRVPKGKVDRTERRAATLVGLNAMKVELPMRRVDFALDPAWPSKASVPTEDGRLHRL